MDQRAAPAGGGYTRFGESSHDRRPDTISWSAVYGYRPAKLRRGYDQWDYRGFAEFTGEHTGNVTAKGKLSLAGGGTVHGDVKVARLSVEDGATLNGNVSMMSSGGGSSSGSGSGSSGKGSSGTE